MDRIANVAAYLCDKYPHKSELSKTRLTKLVYLADWKSAEQTGKQITPIKWYFHNFGPYVEDVIDSVKSDRRFLVSSTYNHYGDPKLEISLKDADVDKEELSEDEKRILDEVITETSPMYWDAFIKHVYSTRPIKASNRYRHLDLVSLAHQT